jgi:hypothetical protein
LGDGLGDTTGDALRQCDGECDSWPRMSQEMVRREALYHQQMTVTTPKM